MKTKSFNSRISLLLSGILLVTLLFTSVFAISSFADTEPAPDTEYTLNSDSRQVSEPEDTEPETEGEGTEADPAEDPAEETEATVEPGTNEFSARKGWLDIIAKPLGYIMSFFNGFGLPYIITLLFFAIVMKVILFPFGIKQQKNMLKQAALRPKETAIRKKYAGRTDKATQQKVQQEIMDLYQKEGYNPASGCLPLLLQMPILFALFQVVYNPLRYITHLDIDVVNKLAEKLAALGHNLSGTYDLYLLDKLNSLSPADYALVRSEITALPEKASDLPNLSIFGISLAGEPKTEMGWYLLIPILTLVLVYLTTVLTKKFSYQPEMTGDAKTSGCIMDWMMPLMSAFFAFTFPAILGIYWMFQNILGVLQQIILKKMYPIPVFSEEDYRQAEKEMFGKIQNKKKPAGGYKRHPNSLHHVDDDEDEAAPAPEKKAEKKPSEPKSSNELIAPAPLKDEDKD